MPQFHFSALATSEAQRLRDPAKARDGLTTLLKTVQPDDGAPCRHCLQDAVAGEQVALASYSPFEGPGPYNERGPVFVHTHDCTRPTPSSDVPAIVAKRLVAVRAYNAKEEIIVSDLTQGTEAPALIERFLRDDATAFLHVRAARNGCFLCRVDRGPGKFTKG